MVSASGAAHMLSQNASRIQKHKIGRRTKKNNMYGYF
jgi:hypothetical protein